jgi:hypothetical protein
MYFSFRTNPFRTAMYQFLILTSASRYISFEVAHRLFTRVVLLSTVAAGRRLVCRVLVRRPLAQIRVLEAGSVDLVKHIAQQGAGRGGDDHATDLSGAKEKCFESGPQLDADNRHAKGRLELRRQKYP